MPCDIFVSQVFDNHILGIAAKMCVHQQNFFPQYHNGITIRPKNRVLVRGLLLSAHWTVGHRRPQTVHQQNP